MPTDTTHPPFHHPFLLPGRHQQLQIESQIIRITEIVLKLMIECACFRHPNRMTQSSSRTPTSSSSLLASSWPCTCRDPAAIIVAIGITVTFSELRYRITLIGAAMIPVNHIIIIIFIIPHLSIPVGGTFKLKSLNKRKEREQKIELCLSLI